jgi:hypothetical protein
MTLQKLFKGKDLNPDSYFTVASHHHMCHKNNFRAAKGSLF